MIKELCFWCGNPFPCGTPHPEGSDELARVLMDLEATTQWPDVDNNLQRAKILGTLLQAERAATLANAAQSIRSTIFYREIDVLETRPFYLRDQIADCVEKQLPHPADASALSAVVQRETAKLRELLSWTMERVGNRMDGFYLSKGDSYDCHYICPGCDADSTIKEFQHKPDCKYAAALEATK